MLLCHQRLHSSPAVHLSKPQSWVSLKGLVLLMARLNGALLTSWLLLWVSCHQRLLALEGLCSTLAAPACLLLLLQALLHISNSLHKSDCLTGDSRHQAACDCLPAGWCRQFQTHRTAPIPQNCSHPTGCLT